jgi:hypothetical protein
MKQWPAPHWRPSELNCELHINLLQFLIVLILIVSVAWELDVKFCKNNNIFIDVACLTAQ